MKLRFWVGFFTLFIFFGFLVFCKAKEEQPAVQEERETTVKTEKDVLIEKMVLAEGMVKEEHAEKMSTLADKTMEMNEKILEHFQVGQESDMEAIADLFGKNATIIKPNYEKIQGRDNIVQVWNEARKKVMTVKEEKRGEVSFKIKTSHIFLTDALGEKEVEIEGETDVLDCVAYVVREIRIIIQEGGKSIKNDTYLGLQTLRHSRVCMWEP